MGAEDYMAKATRTSKGPVFQTNALAAWRVPGTFCDHGEGRVTGLYLRVSGSKVEGEIPFKTLKDGTRVPEQVTKYWSFRYWCHGRDGSRKLKEFGIGPFNEIGLQEARDIARDQRRIIREGGDPITARKTRERETLALIESMKTFEEAAEECWKAHRSKWKERHAEDWINSLKTHAYPIIGVMEIREVDTPHIEKLLAPIWIEKAETATRVRSRVETVFNYAKGKGWYDRENPARWEGKLEALLVESPRLKNQENMPALPVAEVSAFITALRSEKGVAAKAMEFGILTAARSSEIRLAVGQEFDLEKALWTIPAERMKAKRKHIVPLSARAIEIVRGMGELQPDQFVFPGGKRGKCQSDAAMIALMKRMDATRLEAEGAGWRDPSGARIVPHGFRATFKTWAQDHTEFDKQVIEFALAHGLPNKVEAAYARSTMVEKRRILMTEWAEFLAHSREPKGA